jgi:AsmA protein
MRWIFRLLGIAVLVACVVLGALIFLPKDRIAAIASDQLRAQTGREVTVSDELSLSLWPVIGVKTGPLRLSNADWAGDAPMLEADALSIGVDARALLGGDIRITHIEAAGPVIRLARHTDGRVNWAFSDAGPEQGGSEGQAAARRFTLERLGIRDGRLEYSAAGAAPLVISGADLSLSWPAAAGPASFEAVLRPAGQEVTGSGRVSDFAAFLDGRVSPVSLSGKAPGGTVSFDGRANSAGDLAGEFVLETVDTARFLASLGLPATDLPRGAGQRITARADITLTEQTRLALRAMSLMLDGNTVIGEADINLSDIPRVTARLQAETLDFSGVASADGGGSASAPVEAGWSTRPIDASALGLINGDIALRAGTVDMGVTQLGNLNATLSIDRARAVLNMAEVSVFGGTVSGQLVANNRNGLSVGGKLAASQIEMGQMLGELADFERLSGRADARLDFLGVGQNTDQIMRSLSGSGGFAIGRGVIAGIDLDRVMRTGDTSGGTTVFDSLTADFVMKNGDMQNDNLLMLLTNFRAEGAGRIGLGARDIDYLFTPIALRANSGQGLAIPVRIRGPWADPRITPDLERALELDAEGKVEEVKQELRQKVEQKVQEELGIPRQEGQSTEDAVRDAIEQKVEDRLKKLFSRD